MLIDPHPSQQHAGLHHAVWQLQLGWEIQVSTWADTSLHLIVIKSSSFQFNLKRWNKHSCNEMKSALASIGNSVTRLGYFWKLLVKHFGSNKYFATFCAVFRTSILRVKLVWILFGNFEKLGYFVSNIWFSWIWQLLVIKVNDLTYLKHSRGKEVPSSRKWRSVCLRTSPSSCCCWGQKSHRGRCRCCCNCCCCCCRPWDQCYNVFNCIFSAQPNDT